MNLVKIQNNTATREQLPQFLVGLAPGSLLDLSWTDPALGVQNVAWWPVDDQSAPLGECDEYGAETLSIDAQRKVVVVTREVARSAVKVAAKASALRAERNAKLADSDWTQLPDAPVDTAAWAAYRQALRDITAQPGFPFDIEWPAPPS